MRGALPVVLLLCLAAGCMSNSNTGTSTTPSATMAPMASHKVLNFTMPVQTYCEQCTPPNGPTTPGACAGWEQNTQGQDCIWSALNATLAGHNFTAHADANGDVDLSFLANCAPSPNAATVKDFTAAGPDESGSVPSGAGCVVLWNSPAVPPMGTGAATLRFVVS
ncbi:MAG: hypothetical protein ACYDBQ_01400 [Thermoplasmatota archaeon]